jgi:hypothetical protein
MKYLVLLVALAAPLKADLWQAICKVESNNNPRAIGDQGRAVGIAQIWPITVKDANRISKKNYTLNDRYDPIKSREMFVIITEHYGKGKSDETKARIWNAGPKRAHLADKYWEKVKAAL